MSLLLRPALARQTYSNDGVLKSCWIVIHIVAAKTQEAHEDKHEVAVHEPPGVTGEEELQGIVPL